MAREKRYWAYVHNDVTEQFIWDLGEFDSIEEAMIKVGGEIVLECTRSLSADERTFRIVDNENSNTVWIAGPGNQITKPEGWTVMDEPVSKG